MALEKAILEYAASLKSRAPRSEATLARIPGFMDNHVWAMAEQLGEKGFLSTAPVDGKQGLGITAIEEAGSDRLKEIIAEEDRVAESVREKAAALNGAGDRKWWQRLLGKKGASA